MPQRDRFRKAGSGRRPGKASHLHLTVLLVCCLLLASCSTTRNTINITGVTGGSATSTAGASGATGATEATGATGTSAATGPVILPSSVPGGTSERIVESNISSTQGSGGITPGTATAGTGAPLVPAASTGSAPASPAAMLSDPVVDAYFGALPKPAQTKPLQHNEIRGLYIGAAGNLDKALEIARKTEINAVVIDLKESDGVKYASAVPLAQSIGAVKPAYNLKSIVARCHAENVKVIGRIVCFKDPLLAAARPDLTIQDKSGSTLLFSLEGGKPFVSPYNKTVWQYNIDLGREAVGLGVDEIQLDYVRFPTGGTKSGATSWFGEPTRVPSRIQAINRFIQTARVRIQDELGAPLGVDVFAIIVSSKADSKNLGQDWSTLGLLGADSVSPMIYPSHYANASTGHYSGNGKGETINGKLFARPDLYPYDVMYNALIAGKSVEREPGYKVANRPYLQAFTASYLPGGYYMAYGATEIRAQIKAIRDAGYREWYCWNPHAAYPIEAFDPQ